MGQHRRTYTDEFKSGAVDRLYEPGATQGSATKVDIDIHWITPNDNLDGLDTKNLTGPWDQTVDEDIALVERVQPNYSSTFYRSAQYLTTEENSEKFTNWYAQRMQHCGRP